MEAIEQGAGAMALLDRGGNRGPFIFDPYDLADYFSEHWIYPPTNDELGGVSRLARNDEPHFLSALNGYGLLAPEVASVRVPSAWSSAEIPQRCLEDGEWRVLFGLAGYTKDGVPSPRPTHPLTLYRGAPPEYRRRWSWTSDLDQAHWFARRLDRECVGVWTADVQPQRLLAYNHESGRNEAEYVVDTHGLRIHLHERVS